MPVWRGEPFPHRSSSDTALRCAGLDPGVDEDLRAFPGHGGRGAQIVAITDSSGASNPCGGPSAAPHPTSTRRLDMYEYKIATAGQNGQFRPPRPHHPTHNPQVRGSSPRVAYSKKPQVRHHFRATWGFVVFGRKGPVVTRWSHQIRRSSSGRAGHAFVSGTTKKDIGGIMPMTSVTPAQ